jgi:hypothetical protein
MAGMKPPRWLAWLSNLLLLVTILVTGVHAHHGVAAGHDHCMVCTLAHAPAVTAETAPTLCPPAPTRDRAIEIAHLPVTPPLRAVPSSRAPPLA